MRSEPTDDGSLLKDENVSLDIHDFFIKIKTDDLPAVMPRPVLK